MRFFVEARTVARRSENAAIDERYLVDDLPLAVRRGQPVNDAVAKPFRGWFERRVSCLGPLAVTQTIETTTALNVRSTPRYCIDGSNTVATFPAGVRLTVVNDAMGRADENGWVHVHGAGYHGRSVTGWVSKGYGLSLRND